MNISFLHPLSVNAFDLDLLASPASQLLCVFLLLPVLWLLFCCLVCLKAVSHLRFDIPSVIRTILYWWVPWGYLEKQDLPLLLIYIRCRLSPFIMLFPCHLKMRSVGSTRRLPFSSQWLQYILIFHWHFTFYLCLEHHVNHDIPT